MPPNHDPRLLPCLRFQAEVAARLRARGHELREEFPVGSRRGDILDLTANEWLELDRVERPLRSAAAFAQRLASEGAVFRQPEVAGLECRKVLAMEFPEATVTVDEVRRAAERWLGECEPGCAPDEIRVRLGEERLVVTPR